MLQEVFCVTERRSLEERIKATVENSTAEEIATGMLGSEKQKNWEPLAMLLVCKHISDRVYPNNLVLSDGTEIRVTEKNCWTKIDRVCFLLNKEDFFRDTTGLDLQKKMPTIKIVWAGDGQDFVATYFANFKDIKSANSFMRAYRKIWKIVAEGKDISGIKVAFVKEAIMKTVQVK